MGQLIYPVILSGGSGSRLWPVSRAAYPKQFLPVVSAKPMIVETAERVNRDGYARPIVICNEEHRFLVADSFGSAGLELPDIILEPFGRNTAPAVTVAALRVLAEDATGLVLVMPSDHVIRDAEAFHAAVGKAAGAAERKLLATFGITPTHPHTGYGYIQRGEAVEGCAGVHAIRRFVEKPAPDRAMRMVADPAYCWNGGIFLFRADILIEEVRRHAPEILAAARAALDGTATEHGFVRLDPDAFGRAPATPIDIAVMEKTDRGAVVPTEMGWSDIGSWSALWEAAELDGHGNCVSGQALLAGTRNTLVRSADGILTAVVGVEDLIVVTTEDAVLVTSKAGCEGVKSLVADMDRLGRQEHLISATVYRPWGSYRSLDQGEGYLVKRIEVKPGAVLSLQYHNHRSEHWVVVSGEATVTRGTESFVLKPNESTYIPRGEVHRIENRGKDPLSIIEVQIGDRLREDDIVRLEDRYGRQAQEAVAVAVPAIAVSAAR